MTVLIGRKTELKVLGDAVASVRSGKGSTILISGEAGVGKTRLVDEVINIAGSEGFTILKGWCMANSQSPYLPAIEALRPVGLEHLLSQSTPPKLENLFLVTNSGILFAKCERKESSVDSDIFTGMLTAVTHFIDDCIHQSGRMPEGNVFRIGHGNFNISAVHGKTSTLAAIYTGRENEFLLDDMESALSGIESEYGERIKGWKGVRDELSAAETWLRMIFDTEKYEGIDWSKDDPQSRHSGILDNVARGICRTARKNPVLLFIDDLQWADASTLALLHYLSRNTKNSGVLILGTFRPEDISIAKDGLQHPLVDTMQHMGREGLFERLDLKNLSEEEVVGLVISRVSKLDGERRLLDIIWKESQGSPLFVLEMLALLKEEGTLAEKDGIWHLTSDIGEMDVPSKIQDLITRRLSRLLAEQRQTLESASVIGDVFSPEVLEKVTEIRRMQLLRMLNEIEKVHRLIESVERKYRFSHVKIRDVLYAGMADDLKREYHKLVGDTLSELYKQGSANGSSGKGYSRPELAADIGYHYYMAHDAKKAVPVLVSAINIFKQKFSNEDAIRCSKYALELMQDNEWQKERVVVLENLGDLQETTGDYNGAARSFKEAQNIFISSPSTDDTGTACGRMYGKIGGILIKKGDYKGAITKFQKGLENVGDKANIEKGKLLSKIGMAHEYLGDYAKSISYQENAMQIFPSSDNALNEKAKALNRIGASYWHKGDFDKALPYFKKSLKIFEKTDDIRGMMGGLNNIGLIFHFKGQYDEALKYHEESLKLAIKQGSLLGIATSYGNIGLVFDSRGEYDRAISFHLKSLTINEKVGDQFGIGLCFGNIGLIYAEKGDNDRALEYFEKNLAIAEKTGEQAGITTSLINIGSVFHYREEYDKAAASYKKALDMCKKNGDRYGLIRSMAGLGFAYLKKDLPGEAEKLGMDALKLSKESSIIESEGIALKLMGMVHTAQREWETAGRYFSEGVSKLEKSELKKELAEIYLEYGKMLKVNGESDKASEKFSEASRIFDELKLQHLAEKARKECH